MYTNNLIEGGVTCRVEAFSHDSWGYASAGPLLESVQNESFASRRMES